MLQRIRDLENEIAKFEFPLFYNQVLKRDELIRELRRLKFSSLDKKAVSVYNVSEVGRGD